MTTKNRMRLLRLADKIARDTEMKKLVTVEILKKTVKKSKKGEKPIETVAHRLAE